MADPQTENGYTKIANELLEALLAADLGKREQKVVWAVIRRTYGYNRKQDVVTIHQIASMTGLDRRHVSRCLRTLLHAGVVLCLPSGVYRHGVEVPSLRLNKDYDQWQTGAKRAPVNTSRTGAKRAPVNTSRTGAKTAPGPKQPPGQNGPRDPGQNSPQTGAKRAPSKERKKGKEREGARSNDSRQGGNGHGTRLPDDWELTEERLAYARNKGLTDAEAREQAERFVDHWRSQPGQKGRRSDWDATWRNWVRRAPEFSGRRATPDNDEPWYKRATNIK